MRQLIYSTFMGNEEWWLLIFLYLIHCFRLESSSHNSTNWWILRRRKKINTQFNLEFTGNWVDYHGNKSLLKIHVIAKFRNITSLFKISKISFFVLRQCNSLFPANKKNPTRQSFLLFFTTMFLCLRFDPSESFNGMRSSFKEEDVTLPGMGFSFR